MDLPDRVLDLVRHDYTLVEPRLDELLDALGHHGAREIWHKHGTFYDHLLGVWRILAVWGQPADVCRLGLMHSVYSNSFVRMKVFDAAHAGARDDVRRLIGTEAERLVHLFCEIRREELVLLDDLPPPEEGVRVGLHGSEDSVQLSRRELGIFLVVTMADYAEQFFGWQDRLFATPDANGARGGGARTLWPGDNRPGLWMALSARFGRKAATCEMAPLPPVFAGCTAHLAPDAEREARDLYWEVVCGAPEEDPDRARRALERAVERNPFIAEPHVLLAQMCLHREDWEGAQAEARAALDLLAQWGLAWDKRLSWEAWIAWSRVLLKAARERTWPDTAYGIISLGEVRP